MRRQPLNESLRGSVMTKRPRGRAQISRVRVPPPVGKYLVNSGTESSDSARSPITIVGKSRGTCKAGLLVSGESQPFKTSFVGRPVVAANVLTQARKLPGWNLVVLLLVLSLLIRSAMCKPWIEEHPDRVYFRSRICQPVSPTELRKRMGASFDDKTMAADMESARNMFGDNVNMSPWKGTEGYQSDGPAAAELEMDSSNLVESERYISSEEIFLREEGMVYANNGRVEEREEVDVDLDFGDEGREEIDVDLNVDDDVDEGENGSFGKKRTWLPRKRILHSHRRNRDEGHRHSGVYKTFDTSDKDEVDRDNNGVRDSYKYMRRRRRRRSLKSRESKGQRDDLPRKSNKNSRNSKRKDASSNAKQSSKKSNNSFLPLRLILSGKLRNNRKLRKQLKKEFRQQSRRLNKPPPWECKLSQKLVMFKKDVFPRLLIDGRCVTDKCFYRLYNCEPNKYAIKLLQRDDKHCNPLPMVGNSTIYEEKWNLITRHVTVGCQCRSLAGNGKAKNRRKN